MKCTVHIFTDKFQELVENSIAEHMQKDEHIFSGTVAQRAEQMAFYRKGTLGIFANHWIGCDRRNIPTEIFTPELNSYEKEVVGEVTLKDYDKKVQQVDWNGTPMAVVDIPGFAYSECKQEDRTIYQTHRGTVEMLRTNSALAAIKLIVERAISGPPNSDVRVQKKGGDGETNNL